MWQTTKEYLQKYNFVCSPHGLIKPTLERSLIIEVEEKPYCPFVSMVWGHGYKD